MPTLRLRDSLSERSITSRCLPAMAPRVLAMRGEVRSRPAGQSLQQLFRSQPVIRLKPFERLLSGGAVSIQQYAGREPCYGTPDEAKRGSRHCASHPSRGGRSDEGAIPWYG